MKLLSARERQTMLALLRKLDYFKFDGTEL